MDGPALPETADGLWQLEATARDRYQGWCREGALGRVFGGQVAAQALAAANADLPEGWVPASLHAYFVREGRSAAPVDYHVSRLDEQRPDVRIRRIAAGQADKPILIMDAAYRPAAFSLPPLVGGPEPAAWTPSGPDEARWLAQHSRRARFDLRFVDRPSRIAGTRGDVVDGQRYWLRTADRLPDVWIHHACALVYASDMFLVSTALAIHGLPGRRPEVEAASLDHAVWFHRAARADEWVLYEQRSATSAGGRGLTTGRLLDRSGELIATARQEVLQRLPS